MLKFFAIFFAVLVIIGAIIMVLISRQYTITENINLTLPAQIGGTVNVQVELTAKLELSDFSLASNAKMSVTSEDINSFLPTKDFSLLVGELDSPSIVSMLGRLKFIPNTAVIDVDGNKLTATADVEGEFYIRAKRDYKKDEEQPELGDALPYKATVVSSVEDVRFDANWELQMGTRSIQTKLDQATYAKWRDRFGDGDYLATLVEKIINDRSSNILAKLEVNSSEIRPQINKILTRIEKEILSETKYLRILEVKIDNCPVMQENKTISFAAAAQVDFQGGGNKLLIPDLVTRDGPC